MHVVIPDHKVSLSTPNRIEIDTQQLTLFARGESYIISQNADGALRIEAPNGELKMELVSTTPQVARITAKDSCHACALRLSKGLKGSCELHRARGHQGPRIVKSPKPRKVQCASCHSTIEYEPEDLARAQSWGDDVGPLFVKCPKPRCDGRGYPR